MDIFRMFDSLIAEFYDVDIQDYIEKVETISLDSHRNYVILVALGQKLDKRSKALEILNGYN